ncbi:hypothetical protein [Natranaerobius thermophilus]|uniref:Uncharacterized protein n=1 Tax=Natranaerobius thermophilus (strain ATCC BAA-1301 / DSM 18059 / JW/NM-WN-LF) TaxID=457570 RepID=B2A272_NATTJ|nr:hypothetical protein [Natranaerobius thermophilus]ACB86180.1 hypothetical protein Nther_2625 [Natranaerobius thermophilus JW/NM-WN-LF]
MQFNINPRVKKVLSIVLAIVLALASNYFADSISERIGYYQSYYERMTTDMVHDFDNLESELEKLNDNITKILLFEDNSADKQDEYINDDFTNDFFTLFNSICFIEEKKIYFDHKNVYSDVNYNINQILADDELSHSDREYLKKLYSYNDKLIQKHQELMKELFPRGSRGTHAMSEAREKIVGKIHQFSKKADELLATEEFKKLQDFTVDFEAIDYDRAKQFSEELLSLATNKTIKDSQESKYFYEFKSFEGDRDRPITGVQMEHSTGHSKDDDDYDNNHALYYVRYYKEGGTVRLWTRHYHSPIDEEAEKTEAELDELAQRLVSDFNENISKYDKKIEYDEQVGENDIDRITYYYIEEKNGFYDESSKVELTLLSHGLVRELEVMDAGYQEKDDEGEEANVALHNKKDSKEEEVGDQEIEIEAVDKELVKESISEKSQTDKIDHHVEVKDVMAIKNMEGELEYEAHLKFDEKNYAAIFDEELDLKEFKRDLRKYNNLDN